MTKLPDPRPVPVQAPSRAGIGLCIPPRLADCSGERPSWYPFQVNVCDVDAEDYGYRSPPYDWTARHGSLPPPVPTPPYEAV